MSEEINSNFSTLHLLVLKELRYERNVHQGLLAQSAGKSPSAWNKIENGQSALTVDAFFGACSAMNMTPSQVLLIVEKLVPLFNFGRVIFHTTALDSDEDKLLPLVISYYSSKGFENLRSQHFGSRVSVLNLGSPFVTPLMPTVVNYCTNESYRKWIDEGAMSTGTHAIGANY